MKYLILSAFLFAGTSAVAEDGLSWGGELDAKYKVDAETLGGSAVHVKAGTISHAVSNESTAYQLAKKI